jgi:hypothetical protein
MISLLVAACSEDPYMAMTDQARALNSIEARETISRFFMCGSVAQLALEIEPESGEDHNVFHYWRMALGIATDRACGGSKRDIQKLACYGAYSIVSGSSNFPSDKESEVCGEALDQDYINSWCPSDKRTSEIKYAIALTNEKAEALDLQFELGGEKINILRSYYARNCAY